MVKTLEDLVLELLREDKNAFGRMWIEAWLDQIGPKNWHEINDAPLDQEWVIAFAGNMCEQVEMQLRNTDVEELYTDVLKSGHQFLQEIQRKAAEFGVEVPVEEIDHGLRATEMMEKAGLAEIVDGKIVLTEKGEEVGRRFDKGINSELGDL